MINKHDAAEIAKNTAETFRVKTAHRGVDLTGDEYDAIIAVCTDILEGKIDNSMIQDKQYNPATRRVEDARK